MSRAFELVPFSNLVVTDMEITKTVASFLEFLEVPTLGYIVILFITMVISDMVMIFLGRTRLLFSSMKLFFGLFGNNLVFYREWFG